MKNLTLRSPAGKAMMKPVDAKLCENKVNTKNAAAFSGQVN